MEEQRPTTILKWRDDTGFDLTREHTKPEDLFLG